MTMTHRIVMLLAFFLVAACPAWGASAGAVGSSTAHSAGGAVDDVPEAIAMAPLVIDGETLFKVRGAQAYLPQARADDIVARIVAIARNKNMAADAFRVEERPLGSTILAGNVLVMTVMEADARIEGIERAVLAQIYLQKITRAIERYRSDREPKAMVRAAGYAAAALAALAVALYVLWFLRRRVEGRLERRYRARLDDVQIAGFKLLHAERLWAALHGIVTAGFSLLALAGTYTALNFALLQFPATRGLAAGLLDLVVAPIVTMGRGLLAAIPGLVFLFLLVLLTRYVLRTLRLLFGAIDQGSVKLKGFDRDWSWPTYRIVRMLVVAFALVVAFPYIPGSSSEAFKGVSLFLGIVFSLGSTSIIANIIAGYSMTYRRAFRVGDRIKVGDVFGEVTEARLQVTHVRTPKNEEVVVPNSLILNSSVVNYSTLAAAQGLILHTSVGIGYETPWRQVESMLLMAASRTPSLLQQPPPFVLQQALGDFAITYELNVYCDRPGEMPAIYSDLHRNILDVFNEFGVAIMTPAYVADPEQPKLVPKDQWYAEPARR
jgi:small-conductance mechanosensitive channel